MYGFSEILTFARLDPAPGRFVAGALPLVLPVLARLDLVGIVDRACPMRGRSRLTHGEVIAALVANRLTAPRPLYDVVGWAEAYASGDWLGAPASLLNDDRLGRALDAISGHLAELAGALAISAVSSYGLDAARLHWDFTSVAFCGVYAEQDQAGPAVGFGHSSDHQEHCRQLKVAHATTAGGVPLYGRVTGGSRHEGAETFTLLERLRSLACPHKLLLVADSALVTRENLAAADAAGMSFVSRLPRRFGYEAGALALPEGSWKPIAYCSERSARLQKGRRPSFSGAEATIEMTGPDKLPRRFRVLYIYGSEEAGAARANRDKLVSRAEAALAKMTTSLAKRPHQDVEKVARRAAKAVSAGHVGDLLRTEVVPGPGGAVSLRWWRDDDAVKKAEATDGLYALVTNMGPGAPAPPACSASTRTRLFPSVPTIS